MKCVKQGLLVVLLICLVGSPLFAGWDAFRKPSSESSMESLGTSEVIQEETPQEQHQTSSTEEKTESETISENSKNYDENSESYEEKLKETEAILEEVDEEIAVEKSERKADKKREAVEEAKAIVDDLMASKAALDENYNVLADLALRQEKELHKIRRQDAFKFGLGFAVGYKYLDTIPLGFDIGFLFNEEWAVDITMTYDVHALGGLDQFRNPAPENVGMMLTVKKYF